jgi:hypothetical protein
VSTTIAGKPGITALLDGDRNTARLFDIRGVALTMREHLCYGFFWIRKIHCAET